jgi:hypothetical protein
MEKLDIRCIGCGKTPDELDEYAREFLGYPESWTRTDFVRREEGTYNPANGHFACTRCYIAMGQPSTPSGWKAP